MSYLDAAITPNQYQVTVLSTEASRRCKLVGEYLVSPEKEAVSLLTTTSGQIVYCWPYNHLRKFGQVEVRQKLYKILINCFTHYCSHDESDQTENLHRTLSYNVY